MRKLTSSVLLMVGCAASPGVTALHDLHETDDFFALPFPDVRHERADGSVDLTRFPHGAGLVTGWIDSMDGELRGAGLGTAIYFRFDAPIDASNVADAAYLMDITPESPEYGTRWPIGTHYSETPGKFIGASWLAIQPRGGAPLRERTTYAAILTDALHAVDGEVVQRAPDLAAALASDATGSSDPRIAAAATAYAPLSAWLDGHPDERAHLVNASVFATTDATSRIPRLREAVHAQAAPELADLVSDGEDAAGIDQLYEGTMGSPIVMSGQSPFRTAGTGGFVLDASGAPLVQHTDALRVAFTVPEGAMPPAGWPIVIYAHGHNGDYREFVRSHLGSSLARVTAPDGSVLARFAAISIDQPLHGARDASSFDLGTFVMNGNLAAARTVFQQSAADDFQLVRLVAAIDIASAPATGQAIRFDPDRIYFVGFSQGSSTGGMVVAAEPMIHAAVLAGAGGSLFLDFLPNAHKPVEIGNLMSALVQEDVDRFEPIANLLETYVAGSDEESYGRLFVREPLAWRAPTSIFLPLGIADNYVPPVACGDLALAIGAQLVTPELASLAGFDAAQLTTAALPLARNHGAATVALALYQPPDGVDGHFVLTAVPAVLAQAGRFLASHALTGTATLSAP